MRPKDLWVRGRWTIRLETEQIGSACRGSSHGIGVLFRIMWGALLIMAGVRENGGAGCRLQEYARQTSRALLVSFSLFSQLRSVQGLAHLAKSR